MAKIITIQEAERVVHRFFQEIEKREVIGAEYCKHVEFDVTNIFELYGFYFLYTYYQYDEESINYVMFRAMTKEETKAYFLSIVLHVKVKPKDITLLSEYMNTNLLRPELILKKGNGK